jgi:hypothetical protein
MRPSLVVGAAVVLLLAADPASSHLTAAPATSTAASPPREIVLYGHVKSLTRKGPRFELRFDPALWLQGVTAQRAAVEDKAIRPGEPVPNDYYIVDESHRLLTYWVPASARVAVLTRAIRPAAITVSELAQIVKGKNPKHRPLFGPKLGFWIRVATDTVRSLDQQYQP